MNEMAFRGTRMCATSTFTTARYNVSPKHADNLTQNHKSTNKNDIKEKTPLRVEDPKTKKETTKTSQLLKMIQTAKRSHFTLKHPTVMETRQKLIPVHPMIAKTARTTKTTKTTKTRKRNPPRPKAKLICMINSTTSPKRYVFSM